ncbi:CRISPR-associated endoribonuclease Cas6 [Lactococcus hodotermopsidis]|uniref:CRISPR-associated endoribonuclease Cas6 n=2 Tax=Pseudolactococcus hodotermopsidis TaxID=2709157 RepID=A0A6A0B862_9LACT|nr:CRISPR-associated endoribonuclease Cas6 [Lactococcus hodotermopsidis]
MELLPSELVERLHTLTYNPLRQRLLFEKEEVIWEIVGLHKIISEALIKLDNLTEITIKQAKTTVSLALFTKEVIKLDDFVSQEMTHENGSRIISLDFTSPTSFKSNGYYDIFPDIRKIFRSLMMNFDFFSETIKVYDYEVLDYIEEKVHIISYKLMTKNFHLEKIKVKGFQGQITLKITGANQFVKLVLLMIKYATFAGVGTKTSLGMGGVSINEGHRLR